MKFARLARPSIWLFAAQRLSTWYPLRQLLTRLVVATRPRHRPEANDSARLADELLEDGITFLPRFVDGATVDRIRAHVRNLPLRERFAVRRAGFTLDDVPHDVHVAEYATEDILSCPDVVALANHPQLIDAAARYLGCKPTISSMSIWWSLPANDGTAQEAENFHRDVDDWRFVKFFLYLSDVDSGGGPHCFVKRSHRSSNFLRIRRIPDGEVAAAFPEHDRLSIEGKAGDAFLEDTFGLHKGQPPTSKRRLLLQVQYSVGPIAVYDYHAVKRPAATSPVDAYINRLFLR
jgi:hypothetical protein